MFATYATVLPSGDHAGCAAPDVGSGVPFVVTVAPQRGVGDRGRAAGLVAALNHSLAEVPVVDRAGDVRGHHVDGARRSAARARRLAPVRDVELDRAVAGALHEHPPLDVVELAV